MPPPRSTSAGSKPQPRRVSSSAASSSFDNGRSAEGSSSKTSPAAETQLEVLYNTAVQSFVRRDHLKTQATLSRLLNTLGRNQGGPSNQRSYWYELEEGEAGGIIGEDDNGHGRVRESREEWLIKSLKLLISSTISLYTDPPSNPAVVKSQLPDGLSEVIPHSSFTSESTSPEKLLAFLHHRCRDYLYYWSRASDTSPQNGDHEGFNEAKARLLPPQILSTLILASLKLRPASPALDCTHRVCEEWFANLPDSFILSISPLQQKKQLNGHARSGEKSKDHVLYQRKVESAREGYLKVVELFVGEVLSREGEWEMARGFLDGEVVMPSKRKEALYRHLRSLQTSAAQRQSLASSAPSPSSSLVLPVPSTDNVSSENSSDTTRPHQRTRHMTRQRTGSTSSTSSSSSERTARPGTGQMGLSAPMTEDLKRAAQDNTGVTAKGKGKAKEARHGLSNEILPNTASPSSSSDRAKLDRYHTLSLPPSSPFHDSRPQSLINDRSHLSSALALLPDNISGLLKPYLNQSRLSYAFALPLPIILLITLIVRRRRRSLRLTLTPGSANGIAGGSSVSGVDDVKSKLRKIRAQERGWWSWFVYYVRWWIDKTLGVWKLGTTITYM
ncbi:hypothetical protein IAT40_006567 [Kwoniella sp. CBS 6097]